MHSNLWSGLPFCTSLNKDRSAYHKACLQSWEQTVGTDCQQLRKLPNINQNTKRSFLKHQKTFPLPLKQCCSMPVFNITGPIQTAFVGGEVGCYLCSCSFHDWFKITQCLKNSQPFLAAVQTTASTICTPRSEPRTRLSWLGELSKSMARVKLSVWGKHTHTHS